MVLLQVGSCEDERKNNGTMVLVWTLTVYISYMNTLCHDQPDQSKFNQVQFNRYHLQSHKSLTNPS